MISSNPIQTGWGTQQLFFRAGTAGLNSWQIWIRTQQTTETSGEIVDSNRWSRWSMLLTDNGNFTLHDGFYMYGSDGTNDKAYRRKVMYPFGTANASMGLGLMLSSGGRIALATGESSSKVEAKYNDTAGSGEELIMVADTSARIYVNVNDAETLDDADVYEFVFSANGYGYGPSNTNYTHLHYRNSKFATSKPSSLDNGAICYVYE